jgi:hypothetical protein
MSIHETIPSHGASATCCLGQSGKRVAWAIVASQLLATRSGSGSGIG